MIHLALGYPGWKSKSQEQENSCVGKHREFRGLGASLHEAVPKGLCFSIPEAREDIQACWNAAFLRVFAEPAAESTSAFRAQKSGWRSTLKQPIPRQTSPPCLPWGRHRLWATGPASAENGNPAACRAKIHFVGCVVFCLHFLGLPSQHS